MLIGEVVNASMKKDALGVVRLKGFPRGTAHAVRKEIARHDFLSAGREHQVGQKIHA
jgi:hypothetical protein